MSRSPRRAVDPTDGCPGFVSALVLRCARGDHDALGALFDLFFPLVHARLAVLAPHEPIDERVIDTFQRVWQEAPGYQVAEDAVAWVMRHVSDRTPYSGVRTLAS